MSKNDQPATKNDLKEFGKDLATEIIDTVRQEIYMKLTAAKNEMEELLTGQTLELTNAMSEMVQPLQTQNEDHEVRIGALEAKTA